MIAAATRPFQASGDDPDSLRALATKCRCLAHGVSSPEVAASLNEMGAGYERAAARAEASRLKG